MTSPFLPLATQVRRFVFLTLAAVCLGASPLYAETATPALTPAATPAVSPVPVEGPVSFDFIDGDIRTFIQTVSELTGRNFVIDPQVTGKITVVSPSEIPQSALTDVFESILNANGFTVIPAGKVSKILPIRNAKSVGPVGVGAHLAASATGGQIVTQIIPVRHISAKELVTSIRPLISDLGTIISHDESNTLLITDTATNIERLVRIVASLDTAQVGNSLLSRVLKHANAERVADILQQLFNDSRNANPRPANAPAVNDAGLKVVADERTNLLLIVASSTIRARVEEILDQLDTDTASPQATIHLYFLENATAEDLAKILSSRDLWTKSTGEETSQQAAAFASRRAPEGNPSNRFIDDVAITADPSTNSLIVKAAPERYQEILPIIQKLDAPRRQVLVEALIAEVTEDSTRELGVEWRVLDEYSVQGEQVIGIGGTNLATTAEGSPLGRIVKNPADSPTGLVIGAASGTISLNGVDYLSLGALARAFQGNQKVDVLSHPHLLTTDHEEAEIVVGEERPYLKSSQVTTNDSTINSYEYKDVGITLRITPHITQGRRVRLELFQEIKDFLQQTDLGAITTTKRQAKTTVVVDHDQTVIIGGLLRRQDTSATSKVPCVGSVPGLGWLFKSGRRSRAKTNLLIFLTPHVLLEPGEIDPFTKKRQEELPKEQPLKGVLEKGLENQN